MTKKLKKLYQLLMIAPNNFQSIHPRNLTILFELRVSLGSWINLTATAKVITTGPVSYSGPLWESNIKFPYLPFSASNTVMDKCYSKETCIEKCLNQFDGLPWAPQKPVVAHLAAAKQNRDFFLFRHTSTLETTHPTVYTSDGSTL